MQRLKARLIRLAQEDKILGEWYSIAGICLEFSSMDAHFLYGRLQVKKDSDFEQVKFKALYTIDDNLQFELAFVSNFRIRQNQCRGAFCGTANLTLKNPIITITCVSEISVGKDLIVKRANWDFSKSLKCLNFEDFPVHEENDFFDPIR